MEWIDKKIVLNHKNKQYGYGDKIPDGLPQSSLDHFAKMGQIGEVEKVKAAPKPDTKKDDSKKTKKDDKK